MNSRCFLQSIGYSFIRIHINGKSKNSHLVLQTYLSCMYNVAHHKSSSEQHGKVYTDVNDVWRRAA